MSEKELNHAFIQDAKRKIEIFQNFKTVFDFDNRKQFAVSKLITLMEKGNTFDLYHFMYKIWDKCDSLLNLFAFKNVALLDLLNHDIDFVEQFMKLYMAIVTREVTKDTSVAFNAVEKKVSNVDIPVIQEQQLGILRNPKDQALIDRSRFVIAVQQEDKEKQEKLAKKDEMKKAMETHFLTLGNYDKRIYEKKKELKIEKALAEKAKKSKDEDKVKELELKIEVLEQEINNIVTACIKYQLSVVKPKPEKRQGAISMIIVKNASSQTIKDLLPKWTIKTNPSIETVTSITGPMVCKKTFVYYANIVFL